MTTNQALIDKLTAAREAVEKAATDLLAQAEGLAMLVMIERRRPSLEAEVSMDLPVYLYPPKPNHLLRNFQAEEAFLGMVEAAAALAGHRERFVQATEFWKDFASKMMRRDAVERVVGPDYPIPPPLNIIAERMGDACPGVTPEQVHDQAWRDRLMSSAAMPGDRTLG